MRAIFAFLPLFVRLKGPLTLTLVLSLVTLAAGTALLGLSGWFLTAAALSTAGAAFNLFAPSAGVRGLSFIRILSRYGEKLSGHDATLKLLSDLRQWLFARLFPLAPLGRRLGRGDLVSRLLGDVEALDTVFLVALGPISTAVLAGVAMTTLLAFLLPGAALVYALAFAGAAIGVPVLLVAASRRTGAEVVAASGRLRGVTLDSIEGQQDLVIFGETQSARDQIEAAAGDLARARRRLGFHGTLAAGAVQGSMAIAIIGTLVAGLAALEAGSIGGPLMAGLLLAVIASFEACAMLVRSAARLASAAAAAERLQELATMEPAVTDPGAPRPIPDGGAMSLEGVSFGYGPGRRVLSRVNLGIADGSCVAIRGPSGSGKSTIAQLLLRLVDPQAGRVRLNGVDIRTVALADLRRRVALMTQDAPVFHDTIRANLLIGRNDASDEALWQALDAVHLGDFVRSLPRALDTMLGEAGKTLSAGQARRMCLARTLLSNASVIVLDEPTSGLDAETESAFLADLPRIAAGKTTIVITHAQVPANYDRVINVQAGRVSAERSAM